MSTVCLMSQEPPTLSRLTPTISTLGHGWSLTTSTPMSYVHQMSTIVISAITGARHPPALSTPHWRNLLLVDRRPVLAAALKFHQPHWSSPPAVARQTA